MPCKQVDDLETINEYQSQLEACLKRGELIKQVKLHIGNGQQHLCDIWWLPANGLLVGFDRLPLSDGNPRRRPAFWNASGIADSLPNPGASLSIAVEINLKIDQEARPQGTLLKCEGGTVHLGHGGTIRVGLRSLDLKDGQSMKGKVTTVDKRDFIRIAAFGECDAFVNALRLFVEDVQDFRASRAAS